MRTFASDYYSHLRDMYDYLAIAYRPQRFLYAFSEFSDYRSEREYFVHSSNNHAIPPIRPQGLELGWWIVELVYLATWYLIFTFCCFFVKPYPSNSAKTLYCESLGHYLGRIRLPEYFTSRYLLPLMSSVATCTHPMLLAFPANDVIDYKKKTHRVQHYTISGGVREVQHKLSKGLDIRLCARVLEVKSLDQSHFLPNNLLLSWTNSEESSPGLVNTEMFDAVVMAVSPDAVGRMFEPLRDRMDQIPVTTVESTVHTVGSDSSVKRDDYRWPRGQTAEPENSNAQMIYLRSFPGSATESKHIHPSGATMTTSPLSPNSPANCIKRVRFTRVLRTPASRQIVNDIFTHRSPSSPKHVSLSEKDVARDWRNGDGGLWLAGAWCWDGMVLLEGCVVSAERAAHGFGVRVPWKAHDDD